MAETGWVTLSNAAMGLIPQIQEDTNAIISLSRENISTQRHMNYETAKIEADYRKQKNAIQEPYLAMRNSRPALDSDEYKEWSQNFADKKEDYQSQLADLSDLVEQLKSEVQEEANELVTQNNEEIETRKTQKEAKQAQYQEYSQAAKNGASGKN